MGWGVTIAVIVLLIVAAVRSVSASHTKESEQVVVSAGAPVPAVAGGIPEETVAVISAAIAAYMDESAPGTPFAITGITRSLNARPVWGFAGMRQNVRPF